jgi:4-hydroxybenzoate polyprenyltransferase
MASQFLLWRRKSIWLLVFAAISIVLTGRSLSLWEFHSTIAVVWIAFSLVGFVYGMDSLTDERHPIEALFSIDGVKLMPLLLSGLSLAWWRGPVTLACSGLILLLGLSYSYPIETKNGIFRLKSLTGIKSAWIGIGWALLVYLGFGAIDSAVTHWVAGFVALQVMAGSVLRDLDDVEEDRKSGTKTLPIVFGVRTTYALLHGLNLLSGVLLVLMPFEWATIWSGVLIWRAANLEWIRWGSPGHYATQYMNLATCGMIFILRMVFYVMA